MIGDHALDRVRAQLDTPLVIAGRYELRGLLGRGGMGEVHRAYDHQLQREVAVKILPADISAADLAARLEQESRVLAKLEHPGIVPVYDAGTLEDGRVYYVMRYFEGMPLDEYAKGGASRGELLRSLLSIAEAIAYAHERGVIHRDLKPANVMIGPFGDRLVLDWGIAKATGAAGEASGTPGYMPPEQARGEPVDARADVFALGVMLREMLTVHREPITPPMAAIIAMATAAHPEARYATVRDLAADLKRWLDGEAVVAHREGIVERILRFARKHQVAILLLLTYIIVRVFIFVLRGI